MPSRGHTSFHGSQRRLDGADWRGRVCGCFLDADGSRVIHLAERLRANVENQAVKVTGSDDVLRCTVTIGVSPPFHGVHELEDVLSEADAALYRGKAAGRNRIESADVGVSASVEGAKSAMA